MDDYSSQIMSGGTAVSAGLQNLSNQIAQSKENDKARKFNSEEAQKSRDYNTWLLQNETRLKAMDTRAAGLNPAFMNGSLMSSNPSPTSPAAGSPSGTIPFDVSAPYTNMMLLSQAHNLDAGARKNDAEADYKNIENTYLPMLLQSQVNINDGTISLIGQKVHLTKEQAKNIAQSTLNLKEEFNRINAQILNLRQSTANLKQDEIYKKVQNHFASDEFKAHIQQMVASAHCSEAQARYALETLPLQILNLDSQIKLNNATGQMREEQGDLFSLEGDKLAFHLNLDKKYAEIERIVNMVSKALGPFAKTISDLLKLITVK